MEMAFQRYLILPFSSHPFFDVRVVAYRWQELYEPLWDELLLASREHKFGIRAIWIADMAQQGASGVLNEDILGDDRKFTP